MEHGDLAPQLALVPRADAKAPKIPACRVLLCLLAVLRFRPRRG
ncbi:hypothetical protein L842_1149 [Mycobacterium intracellulare MIN_052511_1280]|nr:hypothetical protein L842_1149 [Mycobacterium intracellulare MIN_052511_1280]